LFQETLTERKVVPFHGTRKTFVDTSFPVLEVTIPQSLGARIGQARREKGVREGRDVLQSDVAEALGVGAATVSRWEAGQAIPREDALVRLATYLGVTPAYLRYGTEPFVLPAGATNLRSFPDPDATPDAASEPRPRRGKAGGDR
jgi:transcriptional regulator with XRE-family HTH domain